ncbi:shootin-1 isoform X1 [Petromyzon marinus]|uniref:shootin-1 isoform X1 n=2 Tax=Petromyzon marinus TaxID=7757 RepID=UPI003F6F7DFB
MEAAPNTSGNQRGELKHLLQEAAQEYNVLHAENDKANAKCALLAQERDAAMQELVKLQQVSHLVLEEVNAMQTQLEVQKSCRQRAESFATTLNKENKKLKRMSMAIMAKVGIHEFPDDLLDEVSKELEPSGEGASAASSTAAVPAAEAPAPANAELLLQHRQAVKDLEMRVTELTEERTRLTEELKAAEKEKTQLGEVIFHQEQTFTNYNHVSVLALAEFAEVQKQLELEKELRQKAEEYAHKMLVEQKKMQRQSQMLLQSHAAEQQLMEALEDNATLTSQLEAERRSHQLQVKELQEKLESLELRKELESLQRRLELAEEDMREKDARTERAEASARDLKHEVEELQKRLKKATEPPAPPPLPPMPALPPANPLRTLIALLKKKDAGLPSKGNAPEGSAANGEPDSLEEVRKKAVDEMMERIRRGVPLKPVGGTLARVKVQPKEESCDKPNSAIVELKGILNVMKKPSNVDKTQSTTALSEAGETELERILRRRKETTDDLLVDGNEGGNGNMKYSQSLPSVVKKPSEQEKKNQVG